jgi:hypothetical protein
MADEPRCPNCGRKIDSSSDYCPFCGAPLKKDEGGTNFTPSYSEKNQFQATPTSVNGKDDVGIAGMVVGILSLILPGIGFVLAIIAIALCNGIKDRSRYAKIGFICGMVGLFVMILYIVISIIIRLFAFGA